MSRIETFNYDLLDDNQYTALAGEVPTYDLAILDPPWGDGTLKLFRSTINKMGAEGSWNELMHRFATLCSRASLGTFMLMGHRFTKQAVAIFQTHGMTYSGYWIGHYGSKKTPLDYVYFGNPVNIHNLQLNNLNARHEMGLTAVGHFAEHTPELTIFDPCVGLGDSCWVAKKLGINIIANEINPDRLGKAIRVYERTKSN